MKKNYNQFSKTLALFAMSLFLYSGIVAQSSLNIINDYIKSQKEKGALAGDDLKEWIISDKYTDAAAGITHVYLQQSYHRIPVFNQITVIAVKDNTVGYFQPGFIPQLEKKIKTDKPSLTPENAIDAALAHLGKSRSGNVTLVSDKIPSDILRYEAPELSASPIDVKLMYVPIEGSVVLAWNVSIEMIKEPHWWNIRIDALTGNYLEKNDFTRECSFGETAPAYMPSSLEETTSDCAAPFFMPAPLAPDYRVFPLPIEAPSFGSRSLLSNPASPTASPYGWHDNNAVAGAEYTITRGNNVYAYEDANNDNLPGYSPDGTSNLVFDFPFNAALAPTGNQDASLTNLFYMNNALHDYLYPFGFNEVSGNFQQNNYGNGGAGNDYVNAEGFDGGGTNNANFSTPADGSKPRMQMYLFTQTTPNRDGSFDNGIVAHEFGHGVSNRLTGGPSQSSCLTNGEQGGEGWSDWLALVTTIEPGDQGANARLMGSYAFNSGIRRYPYSTDMTINPQTYATLASSSEVHNVGEIWCDVIWDMTWLLIDQYGYNANPAVSSAGNNIAINLVLQGMKLQPCGPGMLDARDAILSADNLLYNNAHRCMIWQAFARRGMGYNALQGSASVAGDETAGFSMPPVCLIATQPPVANFIATTTTATCGGSVTFTDQSTQPQSWLWNFGDNTTSTTQSPSHTYTSPGTYSVKLVVTNTMGADSLTRSSYITINPAFTTTVAATPSAICSGATVQLSATPTGSTNTTYVVSNISYAPIAGTGTAVTLTDDQMSSAKPIGFTFNFFGNNYTNFYICSNGFITFSSGMPASPVYGQSIPGSATPNNLIALAWNDWNPANAGSSIQYFTTGTAPNRKLIVKYTTSHYGGTQYPLVVQAELAETTNIIEIHSTNISNASAFDAGATTTQGVENSTGTKGVTVSGRNSAIFSATNDAYRFAPGVIYTYNWLPGNITGASPTVTPASSGTYTVQVTDGSACNTSYTSPAITVNTAPAITNSGNISQSLTSGCNSVVNYSLNVTGSPAPSLTYSFTGATTGSGSGNGSGSVFNKGVTNVSVSGTNTCGTANSSFTITVTDNILPTITAPSNITVCNGATISLGTPTTSDNCGVASVTNNAPGSYPNGTTSVIWTVTDNSGNTATATQNVTVNALPTVGSTVSPSATVCAGTSVTLNGTGAATYSWTGGVNNGVSFIPASTATYTVTGTNSNGCINTAIRTITVNQLPAVGSTTTASAVCAGSSVTLNGTGATSYSWSGGVINNVSFTPTATATYTVTGTGANGCSNTATSAITVNPLPTIGSTASATTVCSGTSVTLTGTGAINYSWSGGVINGTSFTLSATTTYTVTGTNANGCSNTATRTITVNPLPTVGTTSTAMTVCSGTSVILNGTGAASYSWSGAVNNGTSFIPATTSTYTVTGTDINGCTNTSAITIIVNPLPTIGVVLTPSYEVCSGTAVTLTATGSSTYNWSDGVINGVPFIATTTINYSVTGTDANGCSNTATQLIKVNSSPIVGITASPSVTVCSGAPVTLIGTGATTYSWSGGVTDGISFTPTVTTTYTVTGTEVSGCTATASITITVTPPPTPLITPSGPTNFCTGGNVVLTSSPGGSYLWSNGATTQNITVTATGNYSVTVNNNGCVGTSATITTNKSTSIPATPLSMTGATNVCAFAGQSTNVTYSTPVVAGVLSWNWTIPANSTLVSGQGTNTILLNYSSSFVSGNVTVSASNGCGTSAVFTKVVSKNIPAMPSTLTGPTAICSYVGTLSQAVYSTTAVTGAASYLWTVPTGATIVSGQGTISINVTYGTSTVSGNVTVKSVANCGSSTAKTLAVTRTIPAMPGTITGAVNACRFVNTGTQVTYSIAAVSGAASYLWTVPTGTTIVSGQGTTSLIVTYGSTFAAGNITVKSVANCGSSAAKTLAISRTANAPVSVSGTTYVCDVLPTDLLTYSTAAVTNALSYLWTVPAGVTLVSGQGTTSINVNIQSSFVTGAITVQAVWACGNSTATSLTLQRSPGLSTAITGPTNICTNQTPKYKTTTVGGATGYSWKMSAGITPQAGTPGTITYNATTFVTTVTGGLDSIFVNVDTSIARTATSYIKVAAMNNCATTAYFQKNLTACRSLMFGSTEENGVNQEYAFSLYPNPNSGEFIIQISSEVYSAINKQQATIEIYDVLGNIVLKTTIKEQTSTINIDNYKNGMYLLRVIDENNKALFTQRIVKQ